MTEPKPMEIRKLMRKGVEIVPSRSYGGGIEYEREVYEEVIQQWMQVNVDEPPSECLVWKWVDIPTVTGQDGE